MTQPNAAPLPEAGKPKLLDQVRNRCRVRHLRPKTERAYVNWIRRFVIFHGVRHPLEMGAKEVSEFLTHLAVEGRVAASTQNQALSALLFLYREVLERDFGWLDNVVRAKKPKHLPVVFTPEEAMGVIEPSGRGSGRPRVPPGGRMPLVVKQNEAADPVAVPLPACPCGTPAPACRA